MKIAISGSACTGKTTLAVELGRHLDLPVIPEHFDSLFALSQKTGDDKISKKEKSNKTIETFFSVLELKHSEEDAVAGFVVDRCPLDLMNLWLATGLSNRRRFSEMFYQHCRQYMQKYDYVVIPPWGKLPLEPMHTDAGRQVRNLNPWSLLHSHATIIGLARLNLRKGRLLLIPANIDSVEERVSFITSYIKPGNTAD